jgi:hypothetical protein
MSTQAIGAAPTERPPLDDVMLAMDVVDTLRHRERLVARELDEAGKAEDLKQRLKRIYAQQGIEVPDHVIEQGVAALREERFVYRPAAGGLRRRLALIYVSRRRWGKWLGGGVGAIVVAGMLNYFAFVAPDKALPDDLEQAYRQTATMVVGEQARAILDDLRAQGGIALGNEDAAAARAVLAEIEALKEALALQYTIRIVNRPGEPSGVWRIPDVNESARNYYVVVEALSPQGERLRVRVESEESGLQERVDTWALRVDEATFEAVRRDKQDDGIIENERFGEKQRGFLQPRYDFPTTGGAITRW